MNPQEKPAAAHVFSPAAAAGALSALLGFLVLFGWHTHNLSLLHLHPAFVAMAYNTALGFFLCGTGLLALAVNRPRLAVPGGIYGVCCGSLTLGEYLFQRDFYIDELFMHAYTTAGVTNGARMAFNTALCFLLMGIFLLLSLRQTGSARLPFVSALIGSLTAGLGAVALTGYLIGVQSYYAWGQFTRMALHTALGFIVLGFGVLAFLWRGSRGEQKTSPRWLPIPVSVGILSLTLSLWQALIVEQSIQQEWLRRQGEGTALPSSLLLMNDLVPQMALGIGLLLAVLLAGLVYLAQVSQQRAALIGTVNRELTAQVQVRREAEEGLKQAHDTLEKRVEERTEELTAANAALREQTVQRTRLENQLLQAQKMESIGRLAGGVAHDFNNLLTVILSSVEMLEEDSVLAAPEQNYLNNVRAAAEKAANLTRQLLAFARRQVIEPEVVNLNTLVLGLDKMLRRLIGEHIELVILPEENLRCIKIDTGQFEQILVNLVVNARDAILDNGKITIETQNAALDAEYARQYEGVPAGDYVMLAVSDTGMGIEEATQLHIFEPFFTTKEKGRGTGLGLATVYGIIKQAGGHIWLYSELGLGTTFKIFLPVTAEAASAGPVPRPAPQQWSGSETVLLVEDESAVRAAGVNTLRKRGYTVLEAANGEEALRLVQGREQEIALLVTDVIMPQMSGKELADRLQRLHPRLKVLFASGYTENTIVHHGVLEPGIAFLPKPFTPGVLAQKVREILDVGSRVR